MDATIRNCEHTTKVFLCGLEVYASIAEGVAGDSEFTRIFRHTWVIFYGTLNSHNVELTTG